ncbi:primosomal protein N' [Leptospira fainei serovar Hurstbridge str. BUT 6]|uniref:Replication restart protein PriA n=1 Tax=Leptospira fainei serovar Hurstbridge str. BUT 6 TaxID=1193011 RepID=S3W6J5_9LEPT|nr:primosomal protein N' [Leptospira fainei]EPG75777.1 primosomal protein N' [Leptospira fainei serovar Hurstbridge str. BUT 6]
MIRYAEIAFDLPIQEDTFTYEVPPETPIGVRVRARLRGRKEEGIVMSVHSNEPSYKVLPVEKIIDKIPIITDEQIKLAYWMKEQYLSSLGECIHKMIPKGRRHSKAVFDREEAESQPLPLNDEQKKAYENIKSDFGKDAVHLLFGITGSGKTEIYLHLIGDLLRKSDKGVLLLVPEIGLTYHIIRKLEAVFPGQIALLHSALKVSERFKAYMDLLHGKKRIAVGTRSAVFAPVPKLGLIIIDEEHDGSFKEHSSPRYHARQVALQRCRESKAVLVLGSATPALEVYHLAVTGKIGLQILSKRPGKAKPPLVRIVENRKDSRLISSDLSFAIKQRLDRKEQVILLLNRRGYSPLLYSENEKSYVPCPNCTSHLCFHKKGSVVCHLCGYTDSLAHIEAIRGEKLVLLGTGTQKLEEHLLEAFPGSKIERLDQDSIQDRSLLTEVIGRLVHGEIDILTGTQMISKGLDAGRVTLVGVLNAGIGLGLPDFRAGERVFSLLTQVAGRAGRADLLGEVIIETHTPDHPIIRMAIDQNYVKFYESELPIRRELFYPPYSRLIRILSRSPDEQASLKTIDAVSTILKRHLPDPNTILLGPAPCPFYKIDKNFRNHLLIKTTAQNKWREVLREEVRKIKIPKNVYLELDFDPVDLV